MHIVYSQTTNLFSKFVSRVACKIRLGPFSEDTRMCATKHFLACTFLGVLGREIGFQNQNLSHFLIFVRSGSTTTILPASVSQRTKERQ
jgi:hypothetical protein